MLSAAVFYSASNYFNFLFNSIVLVSNICWVFSAKIPHFSTRTPRSSMNFWLETWFVSISIFSFFMVSWKRLFVISNFFSTFTDSVFEMLFSRFNCCSRNLNLSRKCFSWRSNSFFEASAASINLIMHNFTHSGILYHSSSLIKPLSSSTS